MTDMQLTRRYAYIVAGLQCGIGITGLALADRFGGISYKPARVLFSFLPGNPGLWWSGLLTILAGVALLCALTQSKHMRTAFALLCGYWSFWAILWAAALTEPAAGPWAPWLALMCVVGNSRPVVAPLRRH